MNGYSLHKECNNEDDALEAYPSGLSQVPNFFVIRFHHRITMLKNKCLELGNLALPEFI